MIKKFRNGDLNQAYLLPPDPSTIPALRQDHLANLPPRFVPVVRLLQPAGLVKLGQVGLEGTEVKANAPASTRR